MKMLTLVPVLGLVAVLQATEWTLALDERQTYELPFLSGDSLIVQNDYGRVRIAPAARSDQVQVRVRRTAASPEGMANVSVVCQKVGTRIYVQAYFYQYTAESVTIDILAPRTLDVIVWGANPAVDLQDMGGFARVETLTGFIRAANLTGSASFFTQNGDIDYTAAVQPQADLRFETVQGNIRCLLQGSLNLQAWMRAGNRVSWGDETDETARAVERQLGSGGPLLLAASEEGWVNVGFAEGPPARIQPGRSEHADSPPRTASAVNTGSAGATESTDAAPPATGPSTGDFPGPLPPSGPTATGPTSSAGGSAFALKVNVNLISVNASVRDRSTDRAVADLTADDFEIYEDGRSQTIAEFDNTEAPFSLLLLLDVSGSTRSYLSLIEQASVQFTRQIKSGDRIALATFNSQTRLRQNFTEDRGAVERAIRRIGSGGGTAFYDALSTCVTEYFEGLEGRKAVVVFTDGVDSRLTGDSANGSTIAFPDLFRQIKERDVLVYTIFLDTEGKMRPMSGRKAGSLGGLLGDIIFGRGGPVGGSGPIGVPGGSPRAYEQARLELEQIADQTGGRMYAPSSIKDLSGAYDEIANDLRVQYTLGYYSSNASNDDRWRKIDIVVPRHSEVLVRHRRGYFGGRN